MEIVLLRVCREMHNLTKRQVAYRMGLTSRQYHELEAAYTAMKPEQAKALEELYNIKASYFLEASRQLELIRSKDATIKSLKEENKMLNQLMEGGYELIHQSKQAKAS